MTSGIVGQIGDGTPEITLALKLVNNGMASSGLKLIRAAMLPASRPKYRKYDDR